MTAAIASKPHIARKIRVIFLSCGVEKALVMIVSFLIVAYVYGYLNVSITRWPEAMKGDDHAKVEVELEA
jgi:hypothetical protein